MHARGNSQDGIKIRKGTKMGLGLALPELFLFFFFFLETNQAQMMEEKPGPRLQSGRATDTLIRVGTIKQPVCSLGSTLSPANYLPAAQKLSVLQIFF